jgi:sortase A
MEDYRQARMNLLSRSLIATGIAFLMLWMVARIHASAGSALAMASFQAGQQAAPAPAGHASPVDTTLWSSKRITAFLQSIGVPSDPPIAVLAIPRIHLQAPVFRGTDDITLNRGIGWIPTTPKPGSTGNSGIAGHRDGFFRGLKGIALNDVIELRTDHDVQTYLVREFEVVEPTDVDVLAPSSDDELTLVTCYPFYFVGSAPNRFIVHAVRAQAIPRTTSTISERRNGPLADLSQFKKQRVEEKNK